jgi:UDP-N-acetylglucosamine 2-epimerase (non-hydrolysing)
MYRDLKKNEQTFQNYLNLRSFFIAILGETNLNFKNILFVEPQGYLYFMFLIKNSFAVITDSGGISEETTVLGIPCFTMRTTTERPETIDIGTNNLVGISIENLTLEFTKFLQNSNKFY